MTRYITTRQDTPITLQHLLLANAPYSFSVCGTVFVCVCVCVCVCLCVCVSVCLRPRAHADLRAGGDKDEGARDAAHEAREPSPLLVLACLHADILGGGHMHVK